MATELPYSIEAEESLLGNIMLYEDTMQRVLDGGITANDFYLDKHRRIFSVMRSMYEAKEKIDSVSLSSRLKDYDMLDKIGGYDYILRLSSATISSSHTKEYIRIIHDKSLLRQVIEAGSKIVEEASGGVSEIGELLDGAERTFRNLSRSRSVTDFAKAGELLDKNLARIHMIQDNKDAVTGVRSSFSALDKITNGFQKGDLIILAARPSMGKTALALNFAKNASQLALGAIAIFSVEMPADQLTMRMLSSESRVDSQKLRTGQLSDEDWSAVNRAAQNLKSRKIYIDDTSNIKVSDISAKCRKLADENEHGLSLIVIDYIQLIQGDKNSESRQQEISEISRSLKALARDLEVPVIALSQLSRSVEKREEKKPMLSDLRESGALEQDADVVLFIYRESYYKRDEENANDEREDVELTIAKHRNGPTGLIHLAFDRNISSFYSVANREGE
ncbi:MAG: replicative DNA helicase [Erysipelotrichaceae bacterium]|jgi:replicative DNA helicase|nr:replicative DNA helicase [Erysipelotrichaceae bacterium]